MHGAMPVMQGTAGDCLWLPAGSTLGIPGWRFSVIDLYPTDEENQNGLRHGHAPCNDNVTIMLYVMTLLSAIAMLDVLLHSSSHDHVHVMLHAPCNGNVMILLHVILHAPDQGHAFCNGLCSQCKSEFCILPTLCHRL